MDAFLQFFFLLLERLKLVLVFPDFRGGKLLVDGSELFPFRSYVKENLGALRTLAGALLILPEAQPNLALRCFLARTFFFTARISNKAEIVKLMRGSRSPYRV